MDHPGPSAERPAQSISLSGLPPELLAVLGLLVLAGGFILIQALTVLPDAFSLLGQGEIGVAFGSLTLAILAVAGFLGVSCLLLAHQIYLGDRVGRILAVVVAGAATFSYLVADVRSGWDTISFLCAIGVIGVLTLSPGVRSHFSTHDASEPSPVVAARALVVALAWLFGLIGVAFLPVGNLDGKFVLVGLGLAGVSLFAYNTTKALATGDPQARNLISGLMGVYLVLLMIAGQADGDLLVPIGIGATVLGLLWLPDQSQEFFGGRPWGLFAQPTAPSPAPAASSLATEGAMATKTCPRCAEEIKAAARVCRFCGHEVEPTVPRRDDDDQETTA